MSFLNIILLSLVQGISEFLPVSSSAHLLFLSKMAGIEEPSLSFVVALHAGSLFAILIYFYKDIWGLIKGFFSIFKGEFTFEFYQSLILIIATFPAVFVGFYLNKMNLDIFKTSFSIGLMSIVFGLLLYIADKSSTAFTNSRYMTIRRGFLIGLGQAVALIPGVSRSGMTLTIARFLGFSRHFSARFIFIMAIPVIFGAIVLKGCDMCRENIPIFTQEIGLGVLFSFIFSLCFLHLLLKWLKNHSLFPIVVYRLCLGILLIVFSYA